MTGLESRPPALDHPPVVTEAHPVYSADTLLRIQEAFGAPNEAAVLHAGTIIVNCPMGKGMGPMSILELVENRDGDPRVAHASDIVLDGVKEEVAGGPNLEPEDIIKTAFGKRSLIMDRETGEVARQQIPQAAKSEISQDSKKK